VFTIIHGTERLLVQETIHAIEYAYRQGSGGELPLRLEGKTLDFSELSAALKTVGMFGAARCVIVEEGLERLIKQEKEKKLIELIGELGAESHLVMVERALDRRRGVVKKILELAKVITAEPVSGGEAIPWLQRRAQTNGIKLDNAAAVQLVGYVGSDLGRLDQELAKLSLFAGDEPISPQMIDQLCARESEENVFALTDAVAAGQTQSALRCLQENLRAGVHPLQLMMLLVSHFRRLCFAAGLPPAQAKAQLTEKLKVHSFPAGKIQQQARVWQPRQLAKLYSLLAQYDLEIKKGHIEADVALEQFVMLAAGRRD